MSTYEERLHFLQRRFGVTVTTDKERIDFLQKLTDVGQYTGRVLLRMSERGSGWRLHETSREDAVTDVRSAIDAFMDTHGD